MFCLFFYYIFGVNSIIAKGFKDRYPSLLDANKVKIEVGITTKERTEQTADAFLQEIQLNQSSDSGIEEDSSSSDSTSGELPKKDLSNRFSYI